MQIKRTIGLAALVAAFATASKAQTHPAAPPATPQLAIEAGQAVDHVDAQTPASPLGEGTLAAPTPEQGLITYTPDFFAGARPATALEMVQRLPGFSFDSGGGVRGFSGGAGNVLIDGQRSLSKTESLDETLRRIPAVAVARIEIIRGGAPGIDMQGRTVLANVVRRETTPLTGGVALATTITWDGRLLPGIRAEAQRRFAGRAFEASLILSQGPDDGLGSGRRIRVNSAGQTLIDSSLDAWGQGTRIWFTGGYGTPFFGGHLRLNGVAQLSPFVAEFTDTLSTGGIEFEHQSIKSENFEISARFTHAVGSNALFELVALEQVGRAAPNITFKSPTVDRLFDLDSRFGETILRPTLSWRARSNLSVEIGVEGAFNWLQSQTQLIINGAPVALPAANVLVQEWRGDVFTEASWRPYRTLNLDAGLHFEASTITSSGDTTLEKTISYLKPRVVLTWSPNPIHQVRMRFEREVGQLNFNDFVAASSVANTGTPIAGNPDIVPQDAWVIEAAYEYRFWRNGVLSITGRRYEISDAVDRIPLLAGNTVIDAPGNIGDGTRSELSVGLTLPLARFGLAGAQFRPSVTWRRTEVRDPVTGETREISGVRPFEWEAHFTHDLPQWRLNWGFDIYGGFRENRYRVTEIERRIVHTYVSLFAEYKPRTNLIFRVELANATSRDFIRVREVHAGPRNTSGLSYIDTRTLNGGLHVLLRVRRTF